MGSGAKIALRVAKWLWQRTEITRADGRVERVDVAGIPVFDRARVRRRQARRSQR